MNEVQALTALAKAQRALLRLTKTRLNDDQLDGLARAADAKRHSEFYFSIRDEWRRLGLISEEEATDCDQIAGLN